MRKLSLFCLLLGLVLLAVGLAGCGVLFEDPEKAQLKADLSFAQAQQAALAKAWSDQSGNTSLALINAQIQEIQARLDKQAQSERDWYTWLVASNQAPAQQAAEAMSPVTPKPGLPDWALLVIGAIGGMILLVGIVTALNRRS